MPKKGLVAKGRVSRRPSPGHGSLRGGEKTRGNWPETGDGTGSWRSRRKDAALGNAPAVNEARLPVTRFFNRGIRVSAAETGAHLAEKCSPAVLSLNLLQATQNQAGLLTGSGGQSEETKTQVP